MSSVTAMVTLLCTLIVPWFIVIVALSCVLVWFDNVNHVWTKIFDTNVDLGRLCKLRQLLSLSQVINPVQVQAR